MALIRPPNKAFIQGRRQLAYHEPPTEQLSEEREAGSYQQLEQPAELPGPYKALRGLVRPLGGF